MEPRDLKPVILRAFSDARLGGRDFLGQIQAGVNAVIMVRPGMSKTEALAFVNDMLCYLA